MSSILIFSTNQSRKLLKNKFQNIFNVKSNSSNIITLDNCHRTSVLSDDDLIEGRNSTSIIYNFKFRLMTPTTTTDNAAIAVITDFQRRIALKNEQIAHLTAIIQCNAWGNNFIKTVSEILTTGRPCKLRPFINVQLYAGSKELLAMGITSDEVNYVIVPIAIQSENPYKGTATGYANMLCANDTQITFDVSNITDSPVTTSIRAIDSNPLDYEV